MPAALVPRLAQVDDPARPAPRARSTATPCPGRCRRRRDAADADRRSTGTAGWVAELWLEILGAVVQPPTTTSSTSAAAASPPPSWSRGCGRSSPRSPSPTSTSIRRSAALAATLDGWPPRPRARNRKVRPTPSKTQVGQVVVHACRCALLAGLRWLTWVAAGEQRASAVSRLGLAADRRRGGGSALGWLLLVLAPGRMALSRARARWLLRRRGARATTRAAGGCTCGCGWPSGSPTSSAPPTSRVPRCMPTYARLLGAKVGKDVDLHSLPPVTGHARLSARAARSSPRSTSAGTGSTATSCTSAPIKVGAGARVGARSTLAPGAAVGERRRGGPRVGGVRRRCRTGEFWSGLARRARSARPAGPGPPSVRRTARGGCWPTPAEQPSIAALPVLASAAGLAVALSGLAATPARSADAAGDRPRAAAGRGRRRPVPRSRCSCWLVVPAARASGWTPGHYPVHSRQAWQAWAHAAGPRRGPHLAVPALRELADPGVAAARSAPGSATTSRRRPCC